MKSSEIVFDEFDIKANPSYIVNVTFSNVTGRRATSISFYGVGIQRSDRQLVRRFYLK